MYVDRVLIVVEDDALRVAIGRVLARYAAEILQAGTLAEARCLLAEAGPDLVLLDVRLPDGSGVALAELASLRRPKPTLIAISGQATAAEAFALGRVGVAGFLDKPFTLDELCDRIEQARSWVPQLEPLVAESVGKRELLDLVATVRSTMVDQALAKAEGSRRGAAKALGVSRQAVQQIVRKRNGAPRAPRIAPLEEV